MELHREEKREEGDRGGQGDKGVSQKERDRSASNQFPKCSSPSGTHRKSQSWVEQRGVREETQVTWWRKRSVQRGREQSSQ